MRQVTEHFRDSPADRPAHRTAAILKQLLAHPTFFHQNVRDRFREAGQTLNRTHQTGIRDHLRLALSDALSNRASVRPYAYIRAIRDHAVTEYLQRFEADVLPSRSRKQG